MKVHAFALVLIAVISPTNGLSQSTQPRYSITISATKTTFKVGSEVRLQIVQKNTTDLNQQFWIENIETLHGEYVFLINATRVDGMNVPRSKYFREVRDEAGNFMPGTAGNGMSIMKKPGESIQSSIDLNELYELESGKYTIYVYQKDKISKNTIKSNTLTVTLYP